METEAVFVWFLFGKFLSSQALQRTNIYYCPSTWTLNPIEIQFIVRVPRVISDVDPFQWWGICKDAENNYPPPKKKKKFRRGVGSRQGGKERRWSWHGGRQKLREECVATRRTQWIESKSLVFPQVNWRSTFNKTIEFWNLVDTCNPDVVIGTESWLREEISSVEVFQADYKTLKKAGLLEVVEFSFV
jgi:hypothetical protein